MEQPIRLDAAARTQKRVQQKRPTVEVCRQPQPRVASSVKRQEQAPMVGGSRPRCVTRGCPRRPEQQDAMTRMQGSCNFGVGSLVVGARCSVDSLASALPPDGPTTLDAST